MVEPVLLLYPVFAGLFGLLIGSFLNVCIYRFPRDLCVVRPRSFCPECEKPIAAYDNIPVLSYVILGRKCRNCAAAIPWRYPTVELLTGAAFFFAVYKYGLTPLALKLAIFAALQIALIFTDLEARILPDEFTIGGTIAGIVLAVFFPKPPSIISMFFSASSNTRLLSVGEALLGACFTSAMLWVFAKFYGHLRKREVLGFGDVKMVAMIGAFFGLQGTMLALVFGCILGVFIGGAYMMIARKKASEYELPLGTFLALASLVLAVGGAPVLTWYSRLG
jgi:leader peptidase (prepilin peptidase)/N-methyltransferase